MLGSVTATIEETKQNRPAARYLFAPDQAGDRKMTSV